MAKKIVLIILLVVLIIGIALLGEWYVDTHRNKGAVVEELNLETATFDLGKGVKLEMVHLPAGTFQMGSDDDALLFFWWSWNAKIRSWSRTAKVSSSRIPVHPVELGEFWIGKYEITQEQYEAVMGKNPSYNKGAKNPVETMTYYGAMEFCEALSAQIGTSFMLPTEAQWEYACRAGSMTAYCFGNNESGLNNYDWYIDNSGGKTHPVGQKKPNHWGLYDMHGNVSEWCRDHYDEKFYAASAATMKNPENTKSAIDYWKRKGGSLRVVRGGSAYTPSRGCRSADRGGAYTLNSFNPQGFRIVRTQP